VLQYICLNGGEVERQGTASITEDMRRSSTSLTAPEVAWGALAMTLTAWSLLAVGLAQANLFQGWALLVAGLLACGIGWLALQTLEPLRCRTPQRETLFLALILVAGLLLFGWPA